MLADHGGIMQIMFLDDEFIATSEIIRSGERTDLEVIQNRLLLGRQGRAFVS